MRQNTSVQKVLQVTKHAKTFVPLIPCHEYIIGIPPNFKIITREYLSKMHRIIATTFCNVWHSPDDGRSAETCCEVKG
jgi:hypothetical protein